jgi:hypothetical protein
MVLKMNERWENYCVGIYIETGAEGTENLLSV